MKFASITEWSGINALLYYGPLLMRSLGFNGSTVNLMVAGGVNIVQFLAVLPAILYIDRWGKWSALLDFFRLRLPQLRVPLSDRQEAPPSNRHRRDDHIAPAHCPAGKSAVFTVSR
jgi:hypothetical protein